MVFCLGALKADRKLLYLMSESDPDCYVERQSRWPERLSFALDSTSENIVEWALYATKFPWGIRELLCELIRGAITS